MGVKDSAHLRLLGVQGSITIIGAAFTYWMVSPPAAKSLAYGCGVALMSTLFQALRFFKEEREECLDAERTLRQAYRTAIERFVWVAIMLGVGFKLIKLDPLWVLVGFVAGQGAWLLLPAWMKFENTK